MTKNLCKDLRDCSIYFPCSYFITGFSKSSQIQQCQNDFVFNENSQECVKPTTREDFQCLLMSNKASLRSNIDLTQASPIKPDFVTKSPISNELITVFEQSFSICQEMKVNSICHFHDKKFRFEGLTKL